MFDTIRLSPLTSKMRGSFRKNLAVNALKIKDQSLDSYYIHTNNEINQLKYTLNRKKPHTQL